MIRLDAIFLDKPLVTDELDMPAPKKVYDPHQDAKKQASAYCARRWSEFTRIELSDTNLTKHADRNSSHTGSEDPESV